MHHAEVDLKASTYSCVQIGPSDIGNTTAWLAATELRMSIFCPIASPPVPTKAHPISPRDSVLLSPLIFVICPGNNYRQKCCWAATKILKQYIHFSRYFFFFSTKYQEHILGSGAYLVITCHKNGPLLSWNITYLMWVHCKKYMHKRGKAGDFCEKSIFLSAILGLPK